MYKSFKDYISGKTFLELDKDGKPTNVKLRVAVVALLWEMAHVDGHRDPKEYEQIVTAIDREFHLMDEQTGHLIMTADFLRRESDQVNRYITEINQSYDREQRLHLYDLIIQVAHADRRITKEEESFAEFLKLKFEL